jgi:hypothetical protein
MTANQEWPEEHFHQAFLFDLEVTPCGDVPSFFKTSHSDAISGKAVARSFTPWMGNLPEQNGHPLPRLVRLAMVAAQECPEEHFHQTDLFDPSWKFEGSKPSFFSTSH